MKDLVIAIVLKKTWIFSKIFWNLGELKIIFLSNILVETCEKKVARDVMGIVNEWKLMKRKKWIRLLTVKEIHLPGGNENRSLVYCVLAYGLLMVRLSRK